MPRTLTVGLRGYPEAVLGSDSVTVATETPVTAGLVVEALTRGNVRLRDALLQSTGRARQSTKVFVDDTLVSPDAPVPLGADVAVLAVLPCDG